MAAQDNLSPSQFGTWYHGTGSDAARSIQEHGLASSKYGAMDDGYVRKPTVTTDRSEAVRYARSRTAHKFPGQTPSVVELHIPHHLSDEYLALEDPGYGGINKPLPASMVHSVQSLPPSSE